MDVQVADTSSLATKRLELENVQPVKQKRGFMKDRIATHAADEADDRAGRPKAPGAPGEQPGGESPGGEPSEEQSATAVGEDADGSIPPDTGGQHVLDVKV